MKLTLRNKLLLVCMVSGLIPLLVVGTIAWRAANQMGNGIASEFRSVAVGIADKIDRNLFERYGDVQAFGLNQVVHDRDSWYKPGDDNPIVQAMNNYVDTYDIYFLTLLVDTDGKLIAVNTSDADRGKINTTQLYDQNFSGEQWFRDAIGGRFYESADGNFTGTVVEHFYVDEAVRSVYKSEGLALGFSAPVRDTEGNVVAIWKNVAKFSLVEEIFSSTYAELKARGLETTELTLLDESGRVLIDFDPSNRESDDVIRDMSVIGKLNLAQTGVEAARLVVQGEQGAITNLLHEKKGIMQCAGFSPLNGALGFPGMKWNVLVRVNADQALAGVHWFKTVILAVGVCITLIIVASSLFLAHKLTAPIRHAIEVLVRMAKGDLTQRMPIDSKDEFADMGRCFNEFASSIERAMSLLSRNSQRLGSSSAELSSVSRSLASGAEAAKGQSGTVAAAAEEMSVNMSNIARSTEEVSSNVHRAANSVEQINTSIGEVASNAERAAAVAGNAANLVEVSNKKIEDLGTAADEIGKVIEVIQDIAEQTNLLALNATIEAARAGEAGKGFAVVATEVKELAKQTAAATDDIRSRIEGIQNSTGDAVSAIREISEVIQHVNEVSRTIAAAVEEQRLTTKEISTNVKQTAVAADTVSKGVSESALASEEITQNISRVDQVLQQTAAGAAQSRTAGDEFSILADELKSLVSGFRTNGTNSSLAS
ncbi:MAG: methyl-accepting chemotaxis protein [Planctomycetales bacterium]|nr:methyl-accepting chemotaxis protein [Planctomycetales bacterium]